MNNKSLAKAEFVIEQQLVACWPDGRKQCITIKVSRPVLEKAANGEERWLCWPIVEGLIEPPSNPIRELSSFRAVGFALLVCRQLLRDEAKGARLYMTGGVLGETLFPEDGLSLKELFYLQ